jgi:hypothetical protein
MIPNLDEIKYEYNGAKALQTLLPHLRNTFLLQNLTNINKVINKEIHSFVRYKLSNGDISEGFAKELEKFLTDNIKV